jgi:hypothetical protein
MKASLTFVAAGLTSLLLIGSADAEPILIIGAGSATRGTIHSSPPALAPAQDDCSVVMLNGTSYTICPAKPSRPAIEPTRPSPPIDVCSCVCDCKTGRLFFPVRP